MSAYSAAIAVARVREEQIEALLEFDVAVRHQGRETHSTVLAADWYVAFMAALETHGHDCRIEVRPAAGGAQ